VQCWTCFTPMQRCVYYFIYASYVVEDRSTYSHNVLPMPLADDAWCTRDALQRDGHRGWDSPLISRVSYIICVCVV
jgi:hypothetical protein